MFIEQHEVLSLSEYSKQRNQIRKFMIQQRKTRCLSLTENIRLAFENKETIKYQIQEVMYATKSTSEADIVHEIKTYQHLIPCGKSLKATLFLEFDEGAEHKLTRLRDIESTVYIQVAGFDNIWPSANEDIGSQRIISPVHYLNFGFSNGMISALKSGAKLTCGVKHHGSPVGPTEIAKNTKLALLNDFQTDNFH